MSNSTKQPGTCNFPSHRLLMRFKVQAWISSCGTAISPINKWLVTFMTGVPLLDQYLAWKVSIAAQSLPLAKTMTTVLSSSLYNTLALCKTPWREDASSSVSTWLLHALQSQCVLSSSYHVLLVAINSSTNNLHLFLGAFGTVVLSLPNAVTDSSIEFLMLCWPTTIKLFSLLIHN